MSKQFLYSTKRQVIVGSSKKEAKKFVDIHEVGKIKNDLTDPKLGIVKVPLSKFPEGESYKGHEGKYYPETKGYGIILINTQGTYPRQALEHERGHHVLKHTKAKATWKETIEEEVSAELYAREEKGSGSREFFIGLMNGIIERYPIDFKRIKAQLLKTLSKKNAPKEWIQTVRRIK